MDDCHIVIMGVSGCGKSTVAALLAKRLDRVFVEGDDYHPLENIAKMASGTALDNLDREAWIKSLCRAANDGPVSVMTCSALNHVVRTWLSDGLNRSVRYVWLHGSETLLAKRLDERSGHFFDPNLLTSQFAALEPPENAIAVSVDSSVEAIVATILTALDQ